MYDSLHIIFLLSSLFFPSISVSMKAKREMKTLKKDLCVCVSTSFSFHF